MQIETEIKANVNVKRLEELFLKLISFDCVSLNEKEVIAWTKTYLQQAGLEVSEDNAGELIGGNGNNLIVWLRGTKKNAPTVFLSAHFDTVEATPGIKVIEQDGVWSTSSDTILGADDKGGMAPAIEAVLSLKESGQEHGDVCLLLSVAEEIGLKGADVLKIDELGLDFGYVLDTGPPVGSFVNRTATHDKIEFIVKGKPAHAGKDPENGINAIVVASNAVSKMKIGRIDPETTTNLGIITGGTAVNVVCPEVKIYAEARSTNVSTLDAQIGDMIRCMEESAREAGTTVEINHARHYGSYEVSETTMVSKIAMQASTSLGLSPVFRTTLGGSDANIYNAKGLPCLVMATGMEKIHTHEEKISRKDLVLTARLALQVLIEAAKVSK